MDKYLIKFDADGRRGETYADGIHFHRETVKDDDGNETEKLIGDTIDIDACLADGFVWISEEEYQYYVGNRGAGDNGTGYVRKDGKPVSAPAYVETVDDKINALDAQFNADKTELVNQYAEAVAVGDTDTAKDVQAQLSELFAEYDKQYTAITEG